ncbi:MAG TPA: DUF4405 domain-containing protein [Thermoanaerobaculia bacterium]|jgi:hypothetical protein|nr:DUF4405 domain-containing protein [Thermoanaerobaculia bacterium]
MQTTSGILRRLPLVFWLDSALLVALLLLLAPRMTGLPIHEWIGISFCAPVVIHVLLSWRWIVATLRSLPSRTTRTRINVMINTALFVLTVIEIVSGLVISRVALPLLGLHTIEDGSWRALHNQALNFTKLAVGLHIAMNWRWIVTALARRSASINKRIRTVAWIPVIRRTLLILIAAALVGLAAFALLGRPSLTREYHRDEIARFKPEVVHGLVQFGGEAMLVALVAYVGKRWLRVRL